MEGKDLDDRVEERQEDQHHAGRRTVGHASCRRCCTAVGWGEGVSSRGDHRALYRLACHEEDSFHSASTTSRREYRHWAADSKAWDAERLTSGTARILPDSLARGGAA